MQAAGGGHTDVVRTLLDAGADVNAEVKKPEAREERGRPRLQRRRPESQ